MPEAVMKEIIDEITDKSILKRMIDIYIYFTEGIVGIKGTLEECDLDLIDKSSEGTIRESQSDFKLKKCGVEADMLYLHYDRSKEECTSCGHWEQFFKVVTQYGRLSTSALFGDQNDMFSIVNIIYDVILPKIEDQDIDIKEITKNIGIIFSNVNCRSNIKFLMDQRLAKLNSIS